jgi:hypothetical protein
VIENHVRAERTILGARRGWVDCANVPINSWPGIHQPERSTNRCGIAAARSDQQIAVSQTKHKAVGCTVAIKIRPEHDVSCRIDCLHWVARERQAKALSAVDRIEEHDDFAPIPRSSREPTGIDSFGSRMVIGKEGNLSGIVN